MRLGIAAKLGIWVSFFGILASGVTAYYSYDVSKDRLIQLSEDKLVTATQVLGSRFTILIEQISNNARLLAELPESRRFFDPSQNPAVTDLRRSHMNEILGSMLMLHPEYYQIRLISAQNHGRELVRVDRSERNYHPIGADALQEKGHYPYVFRTLRLNPGEVYLSQIDINKESGPSFGLDKPTLRVATPVTTTKG